MGEERDEQQDLSVVGFDEGICVVLECRSNTGGRYSVGDKTVKEKRKEKRIINANCKRCKPYFLCFVFSLVSK